MDLPFSAEQFLEVFARYNTVLWPAPVALTAMGVACAGLAWRTHPTRARVASAILAFLWAWMAIAYHFAFFSAINPAARLFGALFLVQALAIAWAGLVRGALQFAVHGDARSIAGGALVALALVGYPALGHLLGQRLPAFPTFGLPCPTTIFTLGMLLLAPAAPRWLLAIPWLWAVIGTSAALQLGIVQDLSLPAAAVVSAFTLGGRPPSALKVSASTRR